VGPHFSGGFQAVAMRAVDLLLTWQERANQRHALAALEEPMLRDIGLTRSDVWREVSKPFWRA